MMISFRSDLRVFVSTQPVDFRKGVSMVLLPWSRKGCRGIPIAAIFLSSARSGAIG